MPDVRIFIGVAQQHGFPAAAAQAALEQVTALVREQGTLTTHFYLYRTAGGALGGTAGAPPPARPRTLLAFTSADAALAFAQHHGLGLAPRLLVVTLPQLLAVLIQRPTISSLLIATKQARTAADGLPEGIRMTRDTLLAQLASADVP
jgi:hypothetical protein